MFTSGSMPEAVRLTASGIEAKCFEHRMEVLQAPEISGPQTKITPYEKSFCGFVMKITNAEMGRKRL